jgi:MoxR-like ATPase
VITTETSRATIATAELDRVRDIAAAITSAYGSRVVGQDNMRTALLVALMTRGHILIEGVPGLAKTTAAQTVALAISATFQRIQCTPDLLPSDILGGQMFDYGSGQFVTQLGPVHANFVLLDEINRSSAKTQSAMLEAMEERQTTIGRTIYPLPDPFLVLATQNPIEQEGTYVLPEAQLDRFLLKEIVEYPSPSQEEEMLLLLDAAETDARPAESQGSVNTGDVLFLQGLIHRVFVQDSIRRYVVAVINATRNPSEHIPAELAGYVEFGASPRGSIALIKVARALALLAGRAHVIPEDVKALRNSVLRHRIVLGYEATVDSVAPETIIEEIFDSVPTP